MTDLVIRRAVEEDQDQVLDLLRESLGTQALPNYDEFFRWKHELNPFGPSPSWVAVADGRIVGFRTFMRWEFRRGDSTVRAVRAVDTATAPDYRGRGIFRTLTEAAREDLRREGVDLIFNTPNDQSRPGYLKMGWSLVGKLPVRMRPRHVGTVPRVLRAKTAADLWSQPISAGDPVTALVGDAAEAGHADGDGRLHTRRTGEYLRWRYGFAPLHYRVFSDDTAYAVVRVRRRGAAREAVVAEDSATDRVRRQRLLRRVLRHTSADYALLLGGREHGGLPVPALGPTLTCLPLSGDEVPASEQWALRLGDVEMF